MKIEKLYIEKCRELINFYIKDMVKTTKQIKKEWKEEEKEADRLKLYIRSPRIYSEQYYAYIKLIRFFKKLKEIE